MPIKFFIGVTMVKNKDRILETAYYACCLFFTFTAVCEIPFAVFWGPVFMLAAFIVYKLYTGSKLYYDTSFIWFAIFTVLYSIFVLDISDDIYYQIYVYLQALIMFFIGCNAFDDKAPDEKRRLLEKYFIVISVMYVLYTALTLYNYFANTPHDLEVRFYYSFWYGELVVKPATVVVMMLVIPMTVGLYSIFFMKAPYKILGALFDIAALAFSFWSGSRTILFFFPFLLLGTIITYFVFVKKNRKAAVIFSLSIAVLCAAAVICAVVFKDKIYDKFHEYGFYRIFYEGFVSSQRNQYALNVLKDFSIFYMGGGKHSAELGTPHNIWLYLYDHGGFIPFFAYCGFTVVMVKNGIKMLFSKKVETQMKFFVFIIFAVILLEYFLEPFILPLPSFYIIGLFLMGVMTAEARREPRKAKKFTIRKKQKPES